MDPKVLCPTLSVMLVKTIKALCEINIKYDQKLEITGSLHVRSDGEKVLTCLLDETTIKGQQDASKAAEIAARLALPNIGFPFPTLQLPTNVSQPQQIAAAFLSPIQQSLGHPGLAPNQGHVSAAAAAERDKHLNNSNQEAMAAAAAAGMLHQERMKPHENHRPVTAHHHHNIATFPTSVHNKVSPSVSSADSMDTEEAVQLELQQAMISLRRQSSGGGGGGGGTGLATTMHELQSQRSKAMTMPSVTKLLSDNALPPMTCLSPLAPHHHTSTNNSQQNHIKLPNIQTLTQCLPKFPQTHVKSEVLSEKVTPPHCSGTGIGGSAPPVTSTAVTPDMSPVSSAASGTPGSAGSNLSMPFPVDPLASIKVEVQQQLDSDGNLVHKKKFQCMFCGIFLSTKCYLKNHINAMHTRARVYPCELCERYFYSAGALRIHKLRNHWQGSKKHKCPHCGETFLLPIELRKHILKKHVGSPEAMMMESGQGLSPGGSPHHGSLAALGMKTETGMIAMSQSHLHPVVTAEAAMAAASLAAAAAVAEPLSLVTSGIQVMPQNLSRTPGSSASPMNDHPHLHDNSRHSDMLPASAANQSEMLHLRQSAMANDGDGHSADGIAPISPATVDSLPE